MKKRMQPLQVGLICGLPAGFLVVAMVLASGPSGATLFSDVLVGFVVGLLTFGTLGGALQWLRLKLEPSHEPAPAGWYDAPNGTAEQWYWNGRTWTEDTRPGVDVDLRDHRKVN